MSLSQIFIRDDFRVDLFEKEVCGKFSLTETMNDRATTLQKMNNLSVLHCSNEDILLFKTMTEREGDLEDCFALATTGIDWTLILKEMQIQIKENGEDVWVTWIGERLDLLEERGLDIPIIKDINKLRDEYFDRLEKELEKKKE